MTNKQVLTIEEQLTNGFAGNRANVSQSFRVYDMSNLQLDDRAQMQKHQLEIFMKSMFEGKALVDRLEFWLNKYCTDHYYCKRWNDHIVILQFLAEADMAMFQLKFQK